MAYLIDSDWAIDHLANSLVAQQLLSRLSQDGIAISIITYMEAYQGVLKSPTPDEAQAMFDAFVEKVPVVALTPDIARRCAQVRETLKKQRKRVNSRALDLLIAATALEHGLTLVTRNTEDFDDIPGLRLFQPN